MSLCMRVTLAEAMESASRHCTLIFVHNYVWTFANAGGRACIYVRTGCT